MDFSNTTARRARKQHTCEECGRIIEPGETYHRTAGSWEGDFFTNVACAHCNAFRKHIDKADDYYRESYFGGAGEWAANAYVGATDLPGTTWEQRLALYRMTREFNRRWRDRTGQLRPVPAEPNREAVPTGAASLIPATEQDTK
ncbi:hypothetical protein PP634_gp86 [Arthrobacter phage Richie]|uniref:Uncharacterized protein n=1 Tax=Arthrobacter phage Richie TaxID=2419967 RepID=A0A3G2KIU0_9CAUD|nr:hypothetical protein PP634_gp86 [Arthrobacter phage Richie]AYN58912.1 hypothetical protein PBI_RICHIE_86 [Arthrobacter phage Richie]